MTMPVAGNESVMRRDERSLLLQCLMSFSPTPRLSVLDYHRVTSAHDPLRPSEPTTAEFESRMRWVASNFHVMPLLDAYEAGEVWLDGYRGRSGYTFAVQAAERAVREATGIAAIDGVELVSVRARPDQGWMVQLRTGRTLHELDVVAERAEEAVYLTCGSVTPQHARRHRATDHRVLAR